MGPLLGPSLGPISPFPLAALKLDEIDQNALLPNQKTVQSDSFAPFFVRQYHNMHQSFGVYLRIETVETVDKNCILGQKRLNWKQNKISLK